MLSGKNKGKENKLREILEVQSNGLHKIYNAIYCVCCCKAKKSWKKGNLLTYTFYIEGLLSRNIWFL